MIEKMTRVAENVGDKVSRRGFLGWLGAGAMAVAGLLVGSVGEARAAATPHTCCKYSCTTKAGTKTVKKCHKGTKVCKTKRHCKITATSQAAHCKACP